MKGYQLVKVAQTKLLFLLIPFPNDMKYILVFIPKYESILNGKGRKA